MTSIFHNDLILLINGFVLQIVYTAKKNYECSIFSSEGFLRKPLIGSCCDRAAAQKQPSLAQLTTAPAARRRRRRARGLGDGCWSSNSSPLPSCSFFLPYFPHFLILAIISSPFHTISFCFFPRSYPHISYGLDRLCPQKSCWQRHSHTCLISAWIYYIVIQI